jgi:gamma-glutamyltranspeptidase/glutathione hydrolase
LGLRADGTVMAFGTPGGDQQDQLSLEFFLAHAVFGLDLQAAIDAPMFHTTHFPSSFYPREAEPRRVEVEGRVPAATVTALRSRGHDVLVGGDWVHGRLSAVARSPDGLLRGAANPRGMQGYAVGR